jgi:hypothetical protein
VNHFDPAQDGASTVQGLEDEDRPDSPLDGTVVLLNAVVEIGTLPNSDRLQFAS